MSRCKNRKIIFNTFMCINCGNSVYSLPRDASYQHKDGHRKRLYCPHCKEEINCIECKTDEDVFNFKIDFENGVYENERQDSLDFVRSTRIW